MKKVLWLIVCLMTMVVSANAQSSWVSVTHEADELTDQKAYTSLVYTAESGTIVLWDNDGKKFRIIANNVFDSKYGENGYMVKGSFFHAIVGYYDINDKLVDKRTCSFIIGSNHHEGNSIRYGMKRYEGKHIISFLRNEKGYVRIVAPLYGTNAKFDIKVPCLSN